MTRWPRRRVGAFLALALIAVLAVIVFALFRAVDPREDEAHRVETRVIRRDVNEVLRSLWPPKDEVSFRAPDAGEQVRFSSLIAAITGASREGDALPMRLVDEATALGFVLQRWEVGGRVFFALTEPADNRRGAGAFLFRCGRGSTGRAALLQAPHAYFDRGTGEIALRMFVEAEASAAPLAFFTNTAHRYQGRPGEKRGDRDHPADVAHAPGTYFHAATHGFLQAVPRAQVIQLHGFGSQTVDPPPDAIVSAGGPPTPFARRVASALSAALPFQVRLFPEGIDRLGGTTNVQRQLVANTSGALFLHVETSSALREALASDDALRRRFSAAVLTPVDEGP